LADILRYLIVCVVTLGIGYALGFRVQTGVLPALAAVGLAVAFGLCFCWISVFVGMTVRSSGSVQGIMFVLVLPLSFISSAFVPPGTLPGYLRAFVRVNPITHIVDTVRSLLTGGPIGMHLLWTLVAMAGLLVVFVPLALRAYNRRT
jgi:oleandomycin transport system permease protein